MSIQALVDRAVAARSSLLRDPLAAARLFHGVADGVAGLVIEKFGPALLVQLHEGQFRASEDEVRAVCESLLVQLELRAAYLKCFPIDRNAALPQLGKRHTDPTPWIGHPLEAEFPIVESDARFLIRPYDGYSVGLFLEHRENRARVRQLAAGRRVLNLFSYTCGFSVAATWGGAHSTDNVDASKRYLEWGRRNFAANDLPLDPHRFFCDDAFAFLRRARRQQRMYDLAILDPPTFGRHKDAPKPFALADDLDRLVADTIDRLAPGGLLLLAVNHRPTTVRRLEEAVRRGAAGRRSEILEIPALPADFAGDPAYSKSVIARFG